MNQHYHISLEDLLVKYLLQEASPEERLRVDQWLAAAPANQQHFDQLKLIWEKSAGSGLPDIRGEEEQAWETLKEKLHQPARRKTSPRPPHAGLRQAEPPQTEPRQTTPRIPIRILRWTAIAAAAAIVAGIWWRPANPALKQISSDNTIRIDTLADGSVVTLNRHSTLTQPQSFAANQRTVSLRGEAFFQIAADKNRPFHVETNGIAITVLGTSFNVRTEDKKTGIAVETGLIEVKNRQKSIKVSAGETITLSENDSTLGKQNTTPPVYHYYRPHDFFCQDTPLGQLVDALNQAYGDSISIADPAIRKMPITTTFHNEPLPRVLDVIKKTLDLTVTYTGSRYILK